jgi:hypothetical protein
MISPFDLAGNNNTNDANEYANDANYANMKER